jgi:hypothetical protein
MTFLFDPRDNYQTVKFNLAVSHTLSALTNLKSKADRPSLHYSAFPTQRLAWQRGNLCDVAQINMSKTTNFECIPHTTQRYGEVYLINEDVPSILYRIDYRGSRTVHSPVGGFVAAVRMTVYEKQKHSEFKRYRETVYLGLARPCTIY